MSNVARLACWTVLAVAWPAVLIFKELVHPRWGMDLSRGGAAVTFILVMLLARLHRPAAVAGSASMPNPSRMEDLARQVTELRVRYAHLAWRQDLTDTRLGEHDGRLDGLYARSVAAFSAIASANRTMGVHAADDELELGNTEPIPRLRVVQGGELSLSG